VQPQQVEVESMQQQFQNSQETSHRSDIQEVAALKKPPKQESGMQVCRDWAQNGRVLIVDRDSMTSDLLATALTREKQFQAKGVRSTDLLNVMSIGKTHVVVIGADQSHQTECGFELAQAVRELYPSVSIVILLDQSTSESVINAFRSGARGVISRQQPVSEFLDCVERVRQGYIWAGRRETTLLLDAFISAPVPNIWLNNESLPLTERELQVVKCAAKGQTNKMIASELFLSEHTVKNYLFRAFEKLGVSNRIELLFHLTQMQCAASSSAKLGDESESLRSSARLSGKDQASRNAS
jgi:two-component system, NarL family, nitrate/nitrite response regulator NarL